VDDQELGEPLRNKLRTLVWDSVYCEILGVPFLPDEAMKRKLEFRMRLKEYYGNENRPLRLIAVAVNHELLDQKEE